MEPVAIRRGHKDGDSAPARRGGRLGPGSVLVIVVAAGVGVTTVLALVTLGSYHRNEHRLLALQTRLTADALAASPLYVQDHLGGAVRIAAAGNDPSEVFSKAMSGSLTKNGPFSDGSLWRLSGTVPHEVTEVGAGPLLPPGSVRMTDLLRQAAVSKAAFIVTRVIAAGSSRLGYAIAARGTGGLFVGYSEEQLPRDREIAVPSTSPVAQLNLVLYLGRKETPSALLEYDSTAPLPLRGTVYTARIPFGDTVLSLTTSPKSSLAGSLSQYLPVGIIAGGALLTALAAWVAWRLARDREAAESSGQRSEQLYAEQRSLAAELQQALLPSELPDVSGVAVALRYIAGTRGVDVGGDWCDVVPLDNDRLVFVVGDVSGRGVAAAAVMASLHFACRAYAVEGHPPELILANLARILRIDQTGHFATVLCGILDLRAREMTLASAGHLPPNLIHDGQSSVVPLKPGPPVGVSATAEYLPGKFPLPAEATLIAYTDGLVERRGESLDAGLTRLLKAAINAGQAPLDDLLGSVCAELINDGPTADDIAMIGLRCLN